VPITPDAGHVIRLRMAEEKLNHEELVQLRSLLRRYCAFDLDQWDLWKTDTPFGPVFIDIARLPRAGISPEMYGSLDTIG